MRDGQVKVNRKEKRQQTKRKEVKHLALLEKIKSQ